MSKFDPVLWPADINWILDSLEDSSHQESIETHPDRGPTHRRPRRSPMRALKGEVKLNEKQWLILEGLFKGSSNLFKAGEKTLLSFIKPPVAKNLSISNAGAPNSETSRTVQIELLVHA
jgi:hypothetical protein